MPCCQCNMKVESCEIVAVLLVAILPTVLVGLIVYHYGQPLDNGIICIALMIFAAVIILWIVTRICKSRSDTNNDKVSLVNDPEALVQEIEPNSTLVYNQTPIFTPIISNLQSMKPKTTVTSDPAQPTGQLQFGLPTSNTDHFL
ncbi:uncharacterized protein [Palaemon carinicauda]|uniref:uncharacterized protein n=1 Tax=Palaemon carinicauda TaxID=392227 RepID=UPI0035B62D4C